MAWNEPGNNGNKDPWGNGNRNNQGPPDLDEALRKFMDKLNGMFGGGKKGGSGGGSGPIIFLLLVVGLAFLGWEAVYTVDQKEKAVVLRFGEYNQIQNPGLAFKIPLIDQVYKVNVTQVRQQKVEGLMLTEDENIVDVSLSVQYVVANPKDFVLKVRDPEVSLRHATESAIRHVVGSVEMHQVLTEGRELLGSDVKVRIQRYLDDYSTGLSVTQVNIENTQAPSEVQAAFDDVIRAKEDQNKFLNEAEAYRNAVIPEARGLAERIRQEANAYKAEITARAEGESSRFEQMLAEYEKAPDVTRKRLYIETMSQVFSRSNKVIVDVEGGNNMMYLPLDKIMSNMPRTNDLSAPRITTSEPTSSSDSQFNNSRRTRTSDRRAREVR